MQTVYYGGKSIRYTTYYTERSTLSIRVEPDLSVRVRAPEDASEAEVRGKVQKRARWIAKQRAHFESFMQDHSPLRYISGETHRYLGRQYRLKIIPIKSEDQEQVKLIGPYFRIYTHRKGARGHVKRQLDDWYRTHAEAKFSERMDAGYEKVRKYGVERPPWHIRRMKLRWGSCTPSGKVILNLELVRAPVHCIDYVILHELCHLKHPHHDPAFYTLLSKVMPYWKDVKHRLREVQF